MKPIIFLTAIITCLMLMGCGTSEKKPEQELAQLTGALAARADQLSRCEVERGHLAESVGALTKDQSSLVDANAKLATQLESRKAELAVQESGETSKALDCEMMIKGLERDINNKDTLLQDARAENERLSSQIKVPDADRKLKARVAARAERLMLDLGHALERELQAHTADIYQASDKVNISVVEQELFEQSGSELSREGVYVMGRLTSVLIGYGGVDVDIRVGVSDVSMDKAWQSAASRAAALTARLAEDSSLKGVRIRSTALPVASAQRGQRRAEIVITIIPEALDAPGKK